MHIHTHTKAPHPPQVASAGSLPAALGEPGELAGRSDCRLSISISISSISVKHSESLSLSMYIYIYIYIYRLVK